MLWVYGHFKCFTQCGYVIFCRLQSVPAMNGIKNGIQITRTVTNNTKDIASFKNKQYISSKAPFT